MQTGLFKAIDESVLLSLAASPGPLRGRGEKSLVYPLTAHESAITQILGDRNFVGYLPRILVYDLYVNYRILCPIQADYAKFGSSSEDQHEFDASLAFAPSCLEFIGDVRLDSNI